MNIVISSSKREQTPLTLLTLYPNMTQESSFDLSGNSALAWNEVQNIFLIVRQH